MRIFYVAQTTPNEADLPQSRIWDANLFLPLVDLGHELIRFSHPWLEVGYCMDLSRPADVVISARERVDFGAQLFEAVSRAHHESRIQLFFSYFSSAHVHPEVIRAIRNLGIVTMNWYCNASYQFHNVAEIAPAYDYCLVPENFRLPDYRAVGANPVYCQEAANPEIYRPYVLPQEFDVTFIGQKYGNRPEYIHSLIKAGENVLVWGPGWQPARRSLWKRTARAVKEHLLRRGDPWPIPAARCGPVLDDLELVKMYSRSKVSLGFTTVAGTPVGSVQPIKQVRLRDFEATMSGAFYLVEFFEELTDFFEVDREIVCFSDPAELVDKVRYYLRHEDERGRIRRAGLRRAREEHTWQKRFARVFQEAGLR